MAFTLQEKVRNGVAASNFHRTGTSLALYREIGRLVGERWENLSGVPDLVVDVVMANPTASLQTMADEYKAATQSKAAVYVQSDGAADETTSTATQVSVAQHGRDILFLASSLAQLKQDVAVAGSALSKVDAATVKRFSTIEATLQKADAVVSKTVTTLGDHVNYTTKLADSLAQEIADLKQEIKRVGALRVTVSVVQAPSSPQPKVTITNSHSMLPVLLEGVSKGLRNFYLWGPAGSGKSTLAKQVAEALGFPVGAQSFTADSSEMNLLGFMAADGKTYYPSLLREYWDKQGVFLGDEFDNLADNIAVLANDGLANGHIKFPDGPPLARHPDMIFIATGNTNMGGATSAYGARVRQDGATRQRWQFVQVGYDELLEEKICNAIDPKATSEFLPWLRQVRKYAIDNVLPNSFIVSPREAVYAVQWFKGGLKNVTLEHVLHAGLWKGLDPATIRAIVAEVGLPTITGVDSIAKAKPEAVYDATKF